uniref:Seminal fluid protein HACP024 n=1 Tax=Heliconius erato TaxID=33431 RepID=D9HQ38_HELEA|nr:seminal fluid protein HACP024 [Heliconius erato]
MLLIWLLLSVFMIAFAQDYDIDPRNIIKFPPNRPDNRQTDASSRHASHHASHGHTTPNKHDRNNHRHNKNSKSAYHL